MGLFQWLFGKKSAEPTRRQAPDPTAVSGSIAEFTRDSQAKLADLGAQLAALSMKVADPSGKGSPIASIGVAAATTGGMEFTQKTLSMSASDLGGAGSRRQLALQQAGIRADELRNCIRILQTLDPKDFLGLSGDDQRGFFREWANVLNATQGAIRALETAGADATAVQSTAEELRLVFTTLTERIRDVMP